MIEPGRWQSNAIPGVSGSWIIERVSRQAGGGDCTLLRCGPVVYMTDLPDESISQQRVVDEVRARGGDVLVSGLGLGLVVEAILACTGVGSVTVLERSADVMRLVAPRLLESHTNLSIIEADVFDWLPPSGRRFSVAWHDIWPNPMADGVAYDIARLTDWYAPSCDWQGFWPEHVRST